MLPGYKGRILDLISFVFMYCALNVSDNLLLILGIESGVLKHLSRK
jgi:hypothetical protein